MYCEKPISHIRQKKESFNRVSIRDNRSNHIMTTAQLAYNYQGTIAATKDNSRDLATWRKNNGEFNLTGMAHNYAYEMGNIANWARSAINRHSEHLVALRKLQNINMNLFTERQPCEDCETDLREFADLPGNQLNVCSFIPARHGHAAGLKQVYQNVWGSVSATTDLT